jgi:hypothetical protein
LTPQVAGGKWRAHQVNVTLGLTNARFVEIKSGLQEGDQVIYAGYDNLTEGAPVVPTEWGPSGPLTLPPATGAMSVGTIYTCPMHPEVKQDHPGDCPKCGMRLQPVAPGSGAAGSQSSAQPTPPAANAPMRSATPSGKAVYTCPMHPEVVQDHPGKCPKCNMNLVRKDSSAPASSGGMAGMGGMK